MIVQTPADVLEAGADFIENVGWTQGVHFRYSNWWSAERKVLEAACLRGSCMVALGKTSMEQTLLGEGRTGLLQETMAAVHADLGMVPWIWNDAPGRTKEEVIEKMRQVAKDLRNNASPTVE